MDSRHKNQREENLQLYSHCGLTVNKAFSPFFMVFTDVAKAGQKYPTQAEQENSETLQNLGQKKFGGNEYLPFSTVNSAPSDFEISVPSSRRAS